MSNQRFLIIAFLLIFPFLPAAQSSDDSKLRFVSEYNEQMDSTNLETTIVFLILFQEESTNVEYLEYRNETLYKLLDKQPKLYLKAMCQLSDDQWNPILNEIESPVKEMNLDMGIIEFRDVDDGCESDVMQKTFERLDAAYMKSQGFYFPPH